MSWLALCITIVVAGAPVPVMEHVVTQPMMAGAASGASIKRSGPVQVLRSGQSYVVVWRQGKSQWASMPVEIPKKALRKVKILRARGDLVWVRYLHEQGGALHETIVGCHLVGPPTCGLLEAAWPELAIDGNVVGGNQVFDF